MKRDSFVFYRSFFEAIQKLRKTDQLKVYSQLCKYALDQELEENDGPAGAIFDLIKPQIDANNQRYVNGKKGAEYGKLGGRPKTPKEPQENPKATPNVNVNVNENVNENENENVNVNVSRVRARNTRPSAQELAIYCFEHGIHTNLEKFMSYNDAKGWPIEWKAALTMWVEKDKEKQQAPKTSSGSKWAGYEQREVTDWDEEERKLLGY